MIVEVEDVIKNSLEMAHGIAITNIKQNGLMWDVEGINDRGVFKTKVTMMILEVKECPSPLGKI